MNDTMKKFSTTCYKRISYLVVALIFTLTSYAQQTWTSAQSGAWGTSSTWTTSGGASGAAPTSPSSTQQVIITNGHTVTTANDLLFDGSSKLTINNGGILAMGSKTLTFKASNNVFTINNGKVTGSGSGGNFKMEAGEIDWTNANLYFSGNIDLQMT
jgi:hypothetical protein